MAQQNHIANHLKMKQCHLSLDQQSGSYKEYLTPKMWLWSKVPLCVKNRIQAFTCLVYIGLLGKMII